jgi:hypothetical protein
MKISIGYITSRLNCQIDWFIDSLLPQLRPDDWVEIFVVDRWTTGRAPMRPVTRNVWVAFVEPKPTVFSGQHRVTKEDWWSKSNSINTFLCWANHDYVVMVDDRCVIGPEWMDAVRRACAGKYVMAGAYQKRTGMTVENGIIKHGGIITGEDTRGAGRSGLIRCGGEWFFGACTGATLEQWLKINGAPERCDGMSFEDVICGILMQNNGFPMYYDRLALVIEDRTPELIGPAILRSAKERHPHDTGDKAHTMLNQVRAGRQRSDNGYEIRELRQLVYHGGKFPLPDPEQKDWFDGQPIKEFV